MPMKKTSRCVSGCCRAVNVSDMYDSLDQSLLPLSLGVATATFFVLVPPIFFQSVVTLSVNVWSGLLTTYLQSKILSFLGMLSNLQWRPHLHVFVAGSYGWRQSRPSRMCATQYFDVIPALSNSILDPFVAEMQPNFLLLVWNCCFFFSCSLSIWLAAFRLATALLLTPPPPPPPPPPLQSLPFLTFSCVGADGAFGHL